MKNREARDKTSTMAVAVAFLSLFIAVLAGATAVWLTSEARVFGLVLLPAAAVAGLLVVYFEWRANLRRRIRIQRDDHG